MFWSEIITRSRHLGNGKGCQCCRSDLCGNCYEFQTIGYAPEREARQGCFALPLRQEKIGRLRACLFSPAFQHSRKGTR